MFLVVPVFGFANAGVSFAWLTLAALVDDLTLGVAGGLRAGKLLGVVGTAALAIPLGAARMPTGASWVQLLGASPLCGIDFTMSRFPSVHRRAGIRHKPAATRQGQGRHPRRLSAGRVCRVGGAAACPVSWPFRPGRGPGMMAFWHQRTGAARECQVEGIASSVMQTTSSENLGEHR